MQYDPKPESPLRRGERQMRRGGAFLAAAALAFTASAGGSTQLAATSAFDQAIADILMQPYQAAYAPAGFDTAFPVDANNLTPVPNTAPAQDYTSGSIPGDPDH